MAWSQIANLLGPQGDPGTPGTTSWDDLDDKPAVIAAGATQGDARTAIGAGTSSLAIGTSGSTAKAGDYQPTWTQVTSKPSTFAPIIGTGAGDAVAGNDSRLTDTRTPTDGSVTTAKFAASALVTEAEGLASSDNDTSVPTAAAVVDALAGKQDADADLTTWAGKTAPTGDVVGTSDSQALTNKDMSGTGNSWPTFDQNTTGSAATLTTPRTIRTNLASTSAVNFDGSANVTPGCTGTLAVARGGTGATTLTGYLTGNGTGAVTASSAIPMSALGTGKVNGSDNSGAATLGLWVGTAAQYAGIGTKDSSTVYCVVA